MAKDIEERALARQELEWRRASHDLVRWVPLATPDYAAPVHLQRAATVFDDIEREPDIGRRVAIEAPPGMGKTELLLHAAVRALRINPRLRILYTTHTAELAKEKSRIARDIALRCGMWIGDEEQHGNFFDRSQSVRYWQTAKGGGFMALGRGGKPIGRRFNRIFIDDPYGDLQEAESPAIQDFVWSWYTGTLVSREEPGCSTVINFQRWNDQDLIARLKKQELEAPSGLEVVTLPAINAFGESLWPERWPVDELLKRKARVGRYVFDANWQQDPKSKGGRLFHSFARWGPAPYRRHAFGRLVLACDPAASKATTANRWAIALGCFHGQGDELELDILRAWLFRAEVPEGVELLNLLQKVFGCPLAVEGGGPQNAIPQTLQRISRDLEVQRMLPKAEKFVKWQPAVAATTRGRISLPTMLDERDPIDVKVRQAIVARDESRGIKTTALLELLDQSPDWMTDLVGEISKVTGVVKNEPDDTADMVSILWDFGERSWVTVEGGKASGSPGAARDLGGF